MSVNALPDDPVILVKLDKTKLVDGVLYREIEYGVERDGKFVSFTQIAEEEKAALSEAMEPGK